MNNDKYEKIVAEFIFRKIEVTCQSCEHAQEVEILQAWIKNIVCLKCKKELLDQNRRTKLLSDKMKAHQAFLMNALWTLSDTKKKSETRQAVIDAYCAMEIVIREKIKNHLKEKNVHEDLIDYLIENVWQTDKTLKLLKALKFKRPEKIKDRIDNVKNLRNKVVHQGYVPSDTETLKTISEIAKIMNGIEPPSVSKNIYSEALSKALEEYETK